MVSAGLVAQEEGRVSVSVAGPREAYTSQPVTFVITFGYDQKWFAEHGVSLFRQQVDVPFHLDIPWLLANPAHAVEVLPCPAEQTVARVAAGDRIVEGRRVAAVDKGGVTFEQIELHCRWLPLSDGSDAVAPVTVRFAYANEFREHLLRGREPVDQQEQRVASAGHELRVASVPKDAPEGWSGAVGEFEIRATSGGQQLHVGETFQVEVTIDGDGNLERFAPLKAPQIDGFHVQGVVERRVEGGRRFLLDVLALRPGVTEMPGVAFVAFSPAEKKFVELRSETVPVKVLPQRPDVALSKHVQELVDADAASQEQGVPTWIVRWGFVALMVVGLVMHRSGRSRNKKRALQDAVHDLRVALGVGDDPSRQADAYEKVMTMFAGGGPFSAPSIWKDLEARGVAAEGVTRLQELHAALDAARFGGPSPPREDVMAAVETVVGAMQ